MKFKKKIAYILHTSAFQSFWFAKKLEIDSYLALNSKKPLIADPGPILTNLILSNLVPTDLFSAKINITMRTKINI